jgi:diaminopimelate decarboxylase
VNGERYAVVRPRQDFDALIGQDRIPDWLEDR